MNKEKILQKEKDFTTIIKSNKSQKNIYFSIYYIKSNQNLYGITVPKKYGKAHTRNKIKRQIKNIIINNEENIPKYFNYVIIIKEAAKKLNYNLLEKELIDLMQKVR